MAFKNRSAGVLSRRDHTDRLSICMGVSMMFPFGLHGYSRVILTNGLFRFPEIRRCVKSDGVNVTQKRLQDGQEDTQTKGDFAQTLA
jgi:hypothetical protein